MPLAMISTQTRASAHSVKSIDAAEHPARTRTECSFCLKRFDVRDVETQVVPSNVRAHRDESFHVWRCPDCGTLHCLEVVDLPAYYQNYPLSTKYGPATRIVYRNLFDRLTRCGFMPQHRFLDYGCGQGLFLRFVREMGYQNGHGYDLYSSITEFRNPQALQKEAYDYILAQDLLEHVEHPRELLRELDSYLRPGGHILIGTPNADDIKLKRHRDYWNQLHPPYHLHIYNRKTLEALGAELAWESVQFYDRPFFDTKAFMLNSRALVSYQRFTDGTADALSDHVRRRRLLLSPSFMFFAKFGYWFSPKADMAVMFRKQGTL